MAGKILTPTSIWNGFTVPNDLAVERISKNDSASISEEKIYLSGRKAKGGSVKIFCELIMSRSLKQAPAILLLQDFEQPTDSVLINDLVSNGYIVLKVDLAGATNSDEPHTVYPESISYANYANVKDNLFKVESEADKTCWYEWVAVARTALAYLKRLSFVTKVGGFAIGEAATVLWQVAGTDKELDSAVFAFNAGWAGYRGINKFAGGKEPQFSDNMYKFIAGIDAQSYAMHVKCPVYALIATNSPIYDCDRAFDTLSYVKDEYYSGINYSVGSVDQISGLAYKNALSFFKKTLFKTEETFPSNVEIKGMIRGGKVVITASPDQKGLKDIDVYVSEQKVVPCKRSWKKLNFIKTKDDEYVFEYSPFATSKIVTAFAVAEYQDGFTVGSNVISIKFDDSEVTSIFKSNVIYSSRGDSMESSFFSITETDAPSKIITTEKPFISVKRGPMGILGMTGSAGLCTLKVGCDKYRIPEGAMLMLDVYAKTKSTLTVTLTCDYFGAKREYLVCVPVRGGSVWQNVQLEINKFKTIEGMPLRSYENIEALSFNVDEQKGEYLINNVLWV